MNATETTGFTESRAQSSGVGVVRGVIGAQVQGAGVLDLRGVTADDLKRLESVQGTGVILIDDGQRAALSHVTLNGVGMVVEIAADERVLMQPAMDIGRVMLENMTPGQSFTIIGMLFFAADVPAAQVAEKFAGLRLIGVLVATEAVQGALFGLLRHEGVTITIRPDIKHLVRGMGNTALTPGYLTHLPEGAAYMNVGRTVIPADTPADLLASRIAAYYNLGLTEGPEPLLEILRARCASDYGTFQPTTTGETTA
jgi:hypothetical protein